MKQQNNDENGQHNAVLKATRREYLLHQSKAMNPPILTGLAGPDIVLAIQDGGNYMRFVTDVKRVRSVDRFEMGCGRSTDLK